MIAPPLSDSRGARSVACARLHGGVLGRVIGRVLVRVLGFVFGCIFGATVASAQDREQWDGFERGYTAVVRGSGLLARGEKDEGRAKIAEGRRLLEENLRAHPEYGPNHYGLALAHFALDEPEAAEAELVECLRKQADYGPARHRLVRHRLDGGRIDEALAALEWFRADAPRFDEQVEHFREAAVVFERLGRHERAFECALEAWNRDITKWSAREPDPDEEPVLVETDFGEERAIAVDDPDVRETLWLLATNAAVAGCGEADAWASVLRRLPALEERGLPHGFRMLDLARRFLAVGDDFVLEELPRRFEGDEGDRVLRFVLSVTDRERPGVPCEDPLVREPSGAARAWPVYFRRRLGERLRAWDELVAVRLPAALDERADACTEAEPAEPAEAAELAVLAGRLRGSISGDRWLFIAQARFDAGDYARAIDALDRGLAAEAKPRFPYKFERLRQRCLREQRRYRPDR